MKKHADSRFSIGLKMVVVGLLTILFLAPATYATEIKKLPGLGQPSIGYDLVPTRLYINPDCSFTAEFRNNGPVPTRPNERTMDQRFVMKGQYTVRGVAKQKSTEWYTDVVVPVLDPRETFRFSPHHLRITGSASVSWTLNCHAEGCQQDFGETNRSNNRLTRTLTCKNQPTQTPGGFRQLK